MAARISYGQAQFETREGESVLDCLSRNGIAVPHSCRSGVCQSCLMRADEGTIPEPAQKDLKPAYKKQDFFLACQCRPHDDMTVSLPTADAVDTAAVLGAKEMLNATVMRVRLETDEPYPCEPGQFITLINPAGVARSYSIANNPATDNFIELHVRLLKDGVMSNFLLDAVIGTPVVVRGPAGNCFYIPEEGRDYPIVMAGTGTGLAPLYGILRTALDHGHKGPIHLFHGALNEPELYLVRDLQVLAQRHGNLHYTPCVLNGVSGQYYAAGHIEATVLAALPPEKTLTRFFLCGAPEFVNALRRKAFLSGLPSKYIFADAFLPSKPVSAAA